MRAFNSNPGRNKAISLAAGVCFAALLGASSANAVTYNLYGTYTDSVTNVTPGDNGPSISNDGLYQGNAGSHSYFQVDNLIPFGPAQYAQGDSGGLLFTVVPNGCITNSHCNGTPGNTSETADINVNFSFYTSTGTLLGSVTDTALATFNYSSQTDNLCWLDGSVGGTAVQSHSAVGVCNPAGSGLPANGYEKITFVLGNAQYAVDLYDWNDWDEQPKVTFQLLDPTVKVPEPFTLSLFGAGLAGAAAMRRRRKR